MSARTAVETIQAAIDRLEGLRATAFHGEWSAFTGGVAHGDHWYVIADNQSIALISANDGSDEEHRGPTANLIVTLHRTIDAQLAILQRTAAYPNVGLRFEPVDHAVLALAAAILGEES